MALCGWRLFAAAPALSRGLAEMKRFIDQGPLLAGASLRCQAPAQGRGGGNAQLPFVPVATRAFTRPARLRTRGP